MRFGFGLITCQRVPGDPRPDEERYAEALALAEEAERLGFDSVWVSEHHFVDDGYLPSLLPMCAAIAARTERIAIGTALVLAPLHDPLRLAEDAAVVDLLSGGRLVLGVGAGWRQEELEAFGVPPIERGSRLEETVAVLRQAWSDEVVVGAGRLRFARLSVTPKPSRPGGPPIWVGAMAEPAIRRAGRIGDGFMATEVTPVSFEAQVATARQERARRGLDQGRFAVSLHVPVFAWRDDDAWERVRDHHRYVAWKYEDMEGARSRTGPPPAPPPLEPREEEALRSSILVGDPATVAEGIDAFRQAAGDDLHFIARLYWPGMDPDVQREAMRCFAQDVVPLLRHPF
jgi:probable F420-dependent oxidoreductase